MLLSCGPTNLQRAFTNIVIMIFFSLLGSAHDPLISSTVYMVHRQALVHCLILLITLSRASLLAASAPCCKDTAPMMAKMDVARTVSIPDPFRLSGCG